MFVFLEKMFILKNFLFFVGDVVYVLMYYFVLTDEFFVWLSEYFCLTLLF